MAIRNEKSQCQLISKRLVYFYMIFTHKLHKYAGLVSHVACLGLKKPSPRILIIFIIFIWTLMVNLIYTY